MRWHFGGVAILAGLVSGAGCSLTTELDGLSGGAASSGGDTTGDAGSGASGSNGSGSGPDTADGLSPTTDAGTKDDRTIPETLFVSDAPVGLHVGAGELFWVATTPPAIWHAAPGTTAVRVDELGDALDSPSDVFVADGAVYWSERQGNRVRKKPFAGGPATTVHNGSGQCAYLVVVGGTAINTDDFTNQPAVGSIVANGMVLYPNQAQTTGLGTDGTSIFWARRTGVTSFALVQASIDGVGTPTEIASAGRVDGVAADANYVYWMQDTRRILRKARSSAKLAEVLYTSVVSFGGGDIAVDANYVYWTETATGRVRRLAKTP